MSLQWSRTGGDLLSEGGEFRIRKQGSLPSMVRYVLFWGGEPVASCRTQREAKAEAEKRAQP